jgi:hypothetical protein
MHIRWKDLDSRDEVCYNAHMASNGRHILSVTYFPAGSGSWSDTADMAV